MGIVFGVTGVAEPAWRQISTSSRNYEVRYLPSSVAAHVQSGNGDGAFPILAGYIGVTSKAKNDKQQSISMTAPVVQTPNTRQEFESKQMAMAFMLPTSFAAVGDCPTPNDDRVKLEMKPGKIVAVKSFSGWCSETTVRRNFEQLLEAVQQDGLVESATARDHEWELAQYNPPFTIPQFRRNEIWLSLAHDMTEAAIVEKLSSS